MTDNLSPSSEQRIGEMQIPRNTMGGKIAPWRLIFVYPSFFLLSPLFDNTSLSSQDRFFRPQSEWEAEEIKSVPSIFLSDRAAPLSTSDAAE
ncbi:hypothetical protein [Sphingomonas spermidinifaciens]|uniref:hypothetical protein n=1 Tax=Sphingomonas spermidinifaciens TaxID=1141889 RepID=UPI001143176F|nr:hypothetical protein [Sphingomonas spermidinifaciens]